LLEGLTLTPFEKLQTLDSLHFNTLEPLEFTAHILP